MRDLYEVLGVDRSADEAALKAAYRKLAMQYHPDRNPDDSEAETRFKEVNAAYEILKDKQKRAAYDTYGHEAFQNGGGGMGGGMGGFADIFEQFFGGDFGQGNRPSTPQKGNDVRVNMTISLEDTCNGVDKQIEIPINTQCTHCNGYGTKDASEPPKCSRCHGSGQIYHRQGPFSIQQTCSTCRGEGVQITDPCKHCRGSGLVQENRKINVSIPAGIEEGQRIRLTGKGEAGRAGTENGDLYIEIRIAPHRLYQRNHADLHCEVTIGLVEASLGTSLEIPLPNGKRVQVKIPEGTQHGQRLRLNGKGMPIMRRNQFGNLYVHARVETPVNLTKRQKELLEEFQGEAPKDNHSPESAKFFERIKNFFS